MSRQFKKPSNRTIILIVGISIAVIASFLVVLPLLSSVGNGDIFSFQTNKISGIPRSFKDGTSIEEIGWSNNNFSIHSTAKMYNTEYGKQILFKTTEFVGLNYTIGLENKDFNITFHYNYYDSLFLIGTTKLYFYFYSASGEVIGGQNLLLTAQYVGEINRISFEFINGTLDRRVSPVTSLSKIFTIEETIVSMGFYGEHLKGHHEIINMTGIYL
jgi:hypothetical protein